MSILNPGAIATAGPSQVRPGPAIAVTATSSGTLKGPQGYTYGWAIVSNGSPWFMNITDALGVRTILPYTADLAVPAAAGIPYIMQAPPGGAITPANPFIQVDWFVAGGGRPSSTFPYALTSQAITGTIQAQQGQVFLQNGIAPTFVATGSTILPTAPGVSTAKCNAIGVIIGGGLPGAGNWLGQELTIQGTFTNANYYQGRPLANWGISPYPFSPAMVLVPFPGDFEFGATIIVGSTGASSGVFYQVVAFLGTPPPSLPPPTVSASASNIGTNTSGSLTIVAAPVDGRSIRVWSIDVSVTTNTISLNVFPASGGADVATILTGSLTSYGKSFPTGYILPSNVALVMQTVGTGQGQADVTYDYV